MYPLNRIVELMQQLNVRLCQRKKTFAGQYYGNYLTLPLLKMLNIRWNDYRLVPWNLNDISRVASVKQAIVVHPEIPYTLAL